MREREKYKGTEDTKVEREIYKGERHFIVLPFEKTHIWHFATL